MNRRAGFTLIELLMVMSLIGILLGIGLGVFARIDTGDRTVQSSLQNALRSAQNWAVARRAPARVVIDPAQGRMHVEGQSVVGTWRFEDVPLRGAFGHDGLQLGGVIVDQGFHGRALSFEDEPARSRVEFPVQRDSAWDLSRGFSVALAVRQSVTRGGALLDVGEVCGLDTDDAGGISGWFVTRIDDPETGARRGGRISVQSAPGMLSPERWSTIELRYDRRTLRLSVDGAPVAEIEQDASVWRLEGPLVLSPSQAPFPGAIDDLVVTAVTAAQELVLPRGAVFVSDAPREILFAAGGGLDRLVHRAPVVLAVELSDTRRVSATVQLYGTVE